ncbi:GNAT family N-acetyltransferase [Corynebacterium bovis]|uniref:GNAT family N-acetyltransferase n=1 Tax=Corynebacterium bovis TaxID=36808 RepID=UPI0025513B3A|nr:GNAT family N-acetyltransferase [Corynebacterium bovis]MDK8511430.1 GNAT family N-acetyltransferase [Corynebacterium bovis]
MTAPDLRRTDAAPTVVESGVPPCAPAAGASGTTATADVATAADAPALVRLYDEVYGGHYPLPFGRDVATVRAYTGDPSVHWAVIRDDAGLPVASALVHTDPPHRTGVLAGIAVHPAHRGRGLADAVTGAACAAAVDAGTVDSLYATVRLRSPGPRHVVLNQGFRPAGILPGAALVDGQEDLGYYVLHAAGARARRVDPVAVDPRLTPLHEFTLAWTGWGTPGPYGRSCPAAALCPASGTGGAASATGGAGVRAGTGAGAGGASGTGSTGAVTTPDDAQVTDVQVTTDPVTVARVAAAADRPVGTAWSVSATLHRPTAVVTPAGTDPTDADVPALLVDVDTLCHSCRVTGVRPGSGVRPGDATATPPVPRPRLADLVAAYSALLLRDGVPYLDVRVPLDGTVTAGALLDCGFRPVAVHPAGRWDGARLHDEVILARTDARATAPDPAAPTDRADRTAPETPPGPADPASPTAPETPPDPTTPPSPTDRDTPEVTR